MNEEMFEFPKVVLTPEQLQAILKEWRKELVEVIVLDEYNKPEPLVSEHKPILTCRKGYDS